MDHHGFGIKQTLSGLSLSPCLLAQADIDGESGEGDGLLQGPNTLAQGFQSPQMDLSNLDLCQLELVPPQENPSHQWMDVLCGSGQLRMRVYDPGPWEKESLGQMHLKNVGEIVEAGKSEEDGLGYSGVMQEDLGLAEG